VKIRVFGALLLASALAAQQKPAASALEAVDEIFQQVAQITALPIKHKVKSAVVSREQIREYIAARMKETTTPAEIHAQEAAYIKFGLLPAGFHLEKFLIDLLAEQATAFYDPKRKMFFLSDWAPLDLQKPAIAHELTHALQDQYIDLNAFLEKKNLDKKDLDKKDLNQDEEGARMAVVEGEGVLAMMEYMLAPSGQHAADVPSLTAMVNDATQAETAKFPVFAAAPAYLRESLLFPYTAGLTFVQARAKRGDKAVYAALLKNPPRSTHEVLHPSDPVVPAELDAPAVPKESIEGFKKLDSNVLGELDISILLKQMLGADDARAVAPGWRGLRYDVYENGDGRVLLAHRSKWKDADAARAFAEAYKRVIAKKSQQQPGAESESRVEVREDVVDVVEGMKVNEAR
jgi:hypothetical protein